MEKQEEGVEMRGWWRVNCELNREQQERGLRRPKNEVWGKKVNRWRATNNS